MGFQLSTMLTFEYLIVWEFKRIGIPGFIAGFSDCPVADLEDIIHFNEQHKSVAMPERTSNDTSFNLGSSFHWSFCTS